MKRWYRVREKAEAEGIYYVYAEGPGEARRTAGDEFVAGRAYWSGLEATPGTGRIVGKAEPVEMLPDHARQELDADPEAVA
jgi:hypothetical protein